MRNLSHVMLSSLCLLAFNSSAFAFLGGSHLEKRLSELKAHSKTSLDLEALEREAFYEKSQNSIEERAWLEGQRLNNQIREAVLRGYAIALNSTGSEEVAREEVLKNMESDLSLIEVSLQDDIRAMVLDILDTPDYQSIKANLSNELLTKLKQRSLVNLALLSQPVQTELEGEEVQKFNKSDISARSQTTKSLLEALVSDQILSERWVSTANMTASSGVTTSAGIEFSAQVSAEFLGVKIAAGPVFKFRTSSSTEVNIKGEGLYPIFDAEGRFDLVAKDSQGRPHFQNGKPVRRFVMFTCEVTSYVESETAVGGGFKVSGVGSDAQVSKKFSTNVSLSSRRVLVPDSIDGREALVSTLARICHNNYMNTRVSNSKTVKQNLETMTKNVVSGLTYVNSDMQCVTTEHCVNWYNRDVIWMHKQNTQPKCIQSSGSDSLMTCQLRGVGQAACAVIQDGKRVSSGAFEYTCEDSYQCTVTHEGGWFQNGSIWDPWKAECRKK